MTEIIRVEQSDGSFEEREATAEEVAQMAAQQEASAASLPHASEDSEQDLFTRAKEITNQELLTTLAYHNAIAAGDPGRARDLLFTGYLAEHYRALVGNRAPTDEELLRYRRLLDDFERLLQQDLNPPSPYP